MQGGLHAVASTTSQVYDQHLVGHGYLLIRAWEDSYGGILAVKVVVVATLLLMVEEVIWGTGSSIDALGSNKKENTSITHNAAVCMYVCMYVHVLFGVSKCVW